MEWVVQQMERRLAIKGAAAKEQRLRAWNNDGSMHLLEFIPIKPSVATGADAPESYARHSRFP